MLNRCLSALWYDIGNKVMTMTERTDAVLVDSVLMRRVIAILLVGLLPAACSDPVSDPMTELPRGAPDDVGMSAQGLTKVQKVVQEFIDNGKIQGAVVGVSRRGKVVYFKAQGLSNVPNKVPLKTDAMFYMASSTKPILGVAAMMMIEEGKFKPTDPIEKYIPEFKNLKVAVPDGSATGYKLVDAQRSITIHDLLTHTSGITYGPKGVDPQNETLATYMPKLAKIPLSFQPGAQWGYGEGLDVVARAIEVVSGMAFNVFVQKRIFDQLGMKDTHWILPKEKQARLLTIVGGKAVTPTTSYFSGSYGLISTARDYLHFEQMLVNKGELFGTRILKPASVEMMSKNQVGDLYAKSGKGAPGMGFGYTVAVTLDPKLAKDGRSAGAFGWAGAAGTVSWTDPKEQLAAVIMVQQPTATLPTRIAEAIRDAMDGKGGQGNKDAGVNGDGKVNKDSGGTSAEYEATGTFKTTHGATGSGTLALKVYGYAITLSKMSSKAGADTKTSGRTVLDISGEANDPGKGTYSYVARFSVADTAMVTGKTLTHDKSSTDLTGELVIPVSGGQPYILGTLASGTLTLTRAGATKGAAVEGSFTARWSGGK